jgi:hypothetical protein
VVVRGADANDLLREVVRIIHGQPEGANVAADVWLGPAALRELDAEVHKLSQSAPADTVPSFEHGAYVLPGGELLLALVTDRGGFAFRVGPGDWGWTTRPA